MLASIAQLGHCITGQPSTADLGQTPASPSSSHLPKWHSAAAALDKAGCKSVRESPLFCPAVSVSYANTDPCMMVRGTGARLFDVDGTEYLDTRNNVCHVGHAHPRVAAAVSHQASRINRFLPSLCLSVSLASLASLLPLSLFPFN